VVSRATGADEALSRSGRPPREIHVIRTRGDRVFRVLANLGGATTLLILFLIGLFLLLKGWPALQHAGWSFFTESEWSPTAEGGTFGVAAALYWTVVISTIGLVLAVPLSIATALFITEYAPARLKGPLTSLVDLLAAVPSLIYGLWGFFFLQNRLLGISAWLHDHFGWIPFFDTDRPQYGSSAFVAGLIVTIMIVPIATSVMREVFSLTPPGEKEAALALGGTRWGMIRAVVLPFGKGGMIGGSMLALGRALGETIALAIILSFIYEIHPYILQAGANGIAPLIVTRFGEAGGIAQSSLMAAGLVLFVLTLAVNVLASVVVARSRSGAGVEI
jgi:phosphate transport system permease protein